MLNTGIRIRNVTRKDSGTYRCEISAKSEEGQRLGEATLTLTVLGTNFYYLGFCKKTERWQGVLKVGLSIWCVATGFLGLLWAGFINTCT